MPGHDAQEWLKKAEEDEIAGRRFHCKLNSTGEVGKCLGKNSFK